MATRDRKDTQGLPRRPSAGLSTSRDPYSSFGGSFPEPFSQFRRLADQMDRWFDTFAWGRTGSRPPGRSDNPLAMNLWAPEIETFLRDDQFVVRVDLPGVDKDSVNVEITDDSLVIQGERQQVQEDEREGFYRSERIYGRFHREVPLPEGAQPETAKANYRDGVLEITATVPARQQQKARRIEIGTSPTAERAERRATGTEPMGVPGSIPPSERTTPTGRPSSVAHDRGGKE